MSIKKIVQEAIEEGKKKAKDTDGFLEHWFQHFGLSDDPFQKFKGLGQNLPHDLFVDRFPELKTLAEIAGMASELRQGFIAVGIIGPDGIGKSTLVQIVKNIAKEKSLEGYTLDIENLVLYDGEPSDLPGNRFPPIDDYSFVVFDNVKPARLGRLDSFLKHFMESSIRPFAVFVVLTPEIACKYEFDREILIKPMPDFQIEKILTSRLQYYGRTPEEILSHEALNKIADCSLGVPSIALEIASNAFKAAYRTGRDYVELEIIESVLERYNYLDMELMELSTKEEEVLRFLLFHQIQETNPNELSENMEMSHTMAWKYLERLYNKGLLEKEYIGRSTRFFLSEFAKKQLQLSLFLRGGNEA